MKILHIFINAATGEIIPIKTIDDLIVLVYQYKKITFEVHDEFRILVKLGE